ncbi:MAG: protein translocase subunit SecD [Verrucomicrobiota bacterium]
MLALTSLFEDPLTLFGLGITMMILFFWYFATEVERRKRNVGSVLLLGVTALCIMAFMPPKERLKLGIDLGGGSSFSLRLQPRVTESGQAIPVTKDQVEQAITIIEKRLNPGGQRDMQISQQGEDGILVQMPGVKPEESKEIKETLEKVAKLELREVSPRNDEPGQDGKTLAQRVDEKIEIIPGFRTYPLKEKDQDGNEFTRPILLSRRVAISGANISSAYPSPSQPDAVGVTLDGEGTDKMIALTGDMQLGVDRLAIVLDGEVISAPVVQARLAKEFSISGLREPGEVQNLVNALMNPLENPLVVDEERTVSPLLGEAVIKQGVWAGVLGLSFTFLFILIYYRTAGLVAMVGLILNVVMLFGVMAMFGFTFTLPGIAGMVLTIGMAVDANVLINERLREELAAGKSLKAAIEAAYEKAFSAIFDSNITSLITAVILFWLSSSSVKGFAVTLTIGLVCSMFSAILGTRVLFRWGVDLGILKNLTFLNLINNDSNYDFLGKRKLWGTIALVMVLISLAGFAWKKEKALGVDFTGGTRIQFLLGSDFAIPADAAEKALSGIELHKAAYPQDESNPTSGHLLTVRCDSRDAKIIEEKLRQSFPELAEKVTDATGEHYKIEASREDISGFIGGNVLRSSILALALGMLGIMLYVTVRFEFSYALGAFIAVLHDCIISVGIIVLLGRELSMIHVGAILTIAGYSINDTIIIFDRIRENVHLHRGSLIDLMNHAINATLSRTILTSTATVVSVLSLAVVGGAALRDFSIVILVGIFVGTFSSIFIASPIVLWFSRGKLADSPNDGLETPLPSQSLPPAN